MTEYPNRQTLKPPADILKQLEQQEWQETFNAMSDLVAVLDRDFRIVKANKAMAAFLGRGIDELVGLHCYEAMHTRSEPWPQCPHKEMLKSGQSVTEEILDPRIGIPLLVTASPVFDEQGNLLGSIHIARDISTLKQAQADVEKRNRELGILWSLGRSAQRSLSFDEVIASALEGVRSAIGPDMALFYLRDGDDLVLRGHLPADAASLNEKKQVGTCLCGLAAQDREPVFSKDIAHDVRCTLSECKEAGIRSFAALPVLHEQELLGVIGIASRAVRDFVEQRELLETITATIAVAARNALLYGQLLEHSASLENSVRERTAELQDSRKALMNIVEDLKEKTGELALANEKLKEVDRLKSLFIASMSHELRTPLNSIIGFTGILLQGLAGPMNEEQKKQLGMVKGSSEHLLSLITDIIDLGKIEAGRIDLSAEAFDLSAAVRAVMGSFHVVAEGKGLKLKVDAPERLMISSDPRRVRQVLVNLVGNAVKFTEAGSVKIEVKKIRSSEDAMKTLPSQLLNLSTSADFAEISVVDTGIGIKQEDMPRLFRSFSQVVTADVAKHEGSGLGLYLSKRLVNLLGGEIQAESEYGKGSVFRFTLPVDQRKGP